MSLTKEMIMSVDQEVECLNDEMLKVYNRTYLDFNKHYPNSFYEYRIKRSNEELINRGYEYGCPASSTSNSNSSN